MEQMLLNIFGSRGIPLRKFWRMMYWMPKFRNLSPWYLPEELPGDTIELARLAIERITSVDPDRKIEIWQVITLLIFEKVCSLHTFFLIRSLCVSMEKLWTSHKQHLSPINYN